MTVAAIVRPSLPAIWRRLQPLTGERLAVGAAAAAIAAIPMLHPAGPGNSSPVDLLIAASIGLGFFWFGSAGLKLRFPYALAMGTFIAAGTLASLAGPFPYGETNVGLPGRVRRGLGVLALVQDLVVLGWCFVLSNVLRSPGGFRVVLRTWAYAAIAWAVLLIGGNAAHLGVLTRTDEYGRIALTFGDPNMAGSYYFVGVMIVWATGRPRSWLLRAGAYLALIYAILLTESNGAILALLIGAAAAAVYLLLRRLNTMSVIAAICFLLVASGAVLSQVHISGVQHWAQRSGQPLLRNSLGRSDDSAFQRRLLLQQATELYLNGGLLGWGVSASAEALSERQATYVNELHNDYIATLVERGILGEIGLFLLIVSVAVRLGFILRRPLAPDFAAAVPRTAPLMGAALGLAASGNYYQVVHFRHLWALLAVIAALYLWSRRAPA